jgi:hypothetical protein
MLALLSLESMYINFKLEIWNDVLMRCELGETLSLPFALETRQIAKSNEYCTAER